MARRSCILALLVCLAGAIRCTSLQIDASHRQREKAKFLKEYGQWYGYGGRIDEMYQRDVAPRFPAPDPNQGVPESHYLDYTAASLYRISQLRAIEQDQARHVYGNPHCLSPSAQACTAGIQEVKAQLLRMWGTTAEEYAIVITRSGTGALQLVGEFFPWSQRSAFLYTRSNHNSVLGIRSYACDANARVGAVDEEDLEAWLKSAAAITETDNDAETDAKTDDLEEAGPGAGAHDSERRLHMDHSSGSSGSSRLITAGRSSAGSIVLGGSSGREQGDDGSTAGDGEQMGKSSYASSLRGSHREAHKKQHGGGQGDDPRVVGPHVLDPETGERDGPMRACMRDGAALLARHGGSGSSDSSSSSGSASGRSKHAVDSSTGSRRRQRCMRADGREEDVTYSLFAYPGCENYAGAMYPSRWAGQVRGLSTPCHRWLTLVDTAATVPHHAVNLTELAPDFAVVSFYKMFGVPSGVGALLVRRAVLDVLLPGYWGGGSVFLATAGLRWHLLHPPPERLESGTLPFLEILALKQGLQAVDEVGGMHAIANHSWAVAEYLHDQLTALRHPNGAPMVRVYGKWGLHKSRDPRRREVQGPTVNLEVLQPDGQVFSYKTVGKEASEARLHVRWGCMCNPGACYNATGVTEVEVRDAAEAAVKRHPHSEEWEDAWEWVDVTRPSPKGKATHVRLPLGSIRTSFGWMSRFEDAYAFWNFINQTYYGRWDAPQDGPVRYGKWA